VIHPERWGPLQARYEKQGPWRMLALDGGGIRGLLTLGILEVVEKFIAGRTGKALHEYFDYIAGTSTGAIIAAGLASGLSVGRLIKFYQDNGESMFESSRLMDRVKSFYTADPLKYKLQEVFGENTTLEPQNLKCLLLVVTKNVTTDSAWPISSNPDAVYNDPQRLDCNLKIPLWQLVRASTAAPIYFPPEILKWDKNDPKKTFVFVDGGVTPHNNPAFLLYRMATEPAYRLNWGAGERNLFLLSVGTGAAESQGVTAAAPNKNLISNLAGLPGDLMYGIQVDQDINCRTVGRCTFGARLDSEILDLVPRESTDAVSTEDRNKASVIPLSQDLGRKFLYARYNADLSMGGLEKMGITGVIPNQIQRMDAVENIPDLLRIGRAAARIVDPAHFGPFI
jgi:predicted acylesterase/phospholipase RssA